MKRIIVIAGHYGSGKTELAVSLALSLANQQGKNYPRLALVDLDVANPYFRSREQQKLLEDQGVRVYSDTFGGSMTAELPALTAALFITDIRIPKFDVTKLLHKRNRAPEATEDEEKAICYSEKQ